MVGQLLKEYKNQNWAYLNIDEKILRDRYDWIKMSFPPIDMNEPWAIMNDINRLFHLCITCNSRKDVLNWIEANLEVNLNKIHREMIDSFCYGKDLTDNDLDFLIEESDDLSLLDFIHSTLERAMLWYDPEPCWSSDFFYFLTAGKSVIDKLDKAELISTEALKTKGENFVSIDEHTHVFYKFQNICLQLEEKKIYSEMKTIAKQSHVALLKSINLFFEHRISTLDEIGFERKLDDIMNKETLWCKTTIKRQG